MSSTTEEQDHQSEADERHQSLQTGQVSEAIHKAAAEMEAHSRFARQIGINFSGQVKLSEASSDQPLDEQEQRYLSYIASEAENFEALDEKYFSIEETANLLASSHHQHRLYALSMLTKLVANREQVDLIFGTVLNPDQSQIISRIIQVIKVSSAYIDCTRRLSDFINILMSTIFSEVCEKMTESLTQPKIASLKGLRLFQVYLSDMFQGGKVFEHSCLVPTSQQALPILDMLFDTSNGPSETLTLLIRSLDKCLTFAEGLLISSSQSDPVSYATSIDCFVQVMQTLHWLSLYSPLTQQLVWQLFSRKF